MRKYLFKNPSLILTSIFLFFFAIFVTKSLVTMINVPFYDFDEAHRAENAKRMKEYRSFFVPLTGSSQDRVEHLKIPLKENSDFYLYYHLERPPLVYDLMMISTSIFGTSEWAYRLPSLVFGILTLIIVVLFAKKVRSDIFAISVSLLSLITSADLWLSSQYAQMDTTITFFLTASLLTLIHFAQSRKTWLIYLSGILFGFALLSKLQPTVIFIIPLIYLLIIKRIKFLDLLKFNLGFLIIFLPWIIYLWWQFGLEDILQIMPGFAITSASIINIHQNAPIFWYLRWWWEVFRPGWILFLALFFVDILSKKLNWGKITLLSYIFGGLVTFSLPTNKIWWYVLPLVPAVCYYIFLSVEDYIRKEKNAVNNLAFALLIASLPLFLKSSNFISLLYGITLTILIFLILQNKLRFELRLKLKKEMVFYASVIISLLFSLLQFPQIVPYHWNTKPVALYYQHLPKPKCLWLGDMPGESALFYSNAGEVHVLTEYYKTSQIFSNCKNNFLITPKRYKDGKLLFRTGNMRLYQLTKDSQKISE